jgi:prevent-host-death family protein
MQVTIHEAKTHLSRLIAAVERGGEVIIARRDKPVVRLVIESPARPKRRLGFMLKPGQEPPNLGGLSDKKLEEEIERDFYEAVEADKPYRPGPSPNG